MSEAFMINITGEHDMFEKVVNWSIGPIIILIIMNNLGYFS
ncbi:hypothetical protein [Escherichia phage ECA2]|uniref:Uncharacterized protein n=7 Tax=Teetrevirus TaxID=2732693 RepID=A0A193GYP5_9CAUD|nr:hypothetical protein HOR17_gp18 [Escherichia phage ECA2]ANN86242.1 hypothetical protein [Escherichia phage ECA2]